ncbi:hypothetical protein H2203_008712 [Taxawa tesnikishii (nom. ined.)]|nr:hypothetical protein H2203_008712 [Dothideales sp. JES 119]
MAPPQLNLLRPLLLLAFSAAFIPITIFKLVTTFQFSKLASWAAFQHAWFGRFWAWFGPQSREYGGPAVEPILAKARGVVLDIGPGNGQWVNLFSAAKNKDIKKIYGVEPNPDHHAALRQRVKSAGLEGIYEVLPVGVEDLESCGIEKGSVDTIATIQCLCSVPGPEDIIKSLYPYLKPGGQWLVYEHVRTPHQHDFVATWQAAIDNIWPSFFGGCSITRPTDEWLLQAGEWDSVGLHPAKGRANTTPSLTSWAFW